MLDLEICGTTSKYSSLWPGHPKLGASIGDVNGSSGTCDFKPIFDNVTESDLLLRSLQRALKKTKPAAESPS
jgi:hypothetical protein